jgi:hypothetical protein
LFVTCSVKFERNATVVVPWQIIGYLICLFVQLDRWVTSIEHVLQCLHCASIQS